MRPGMMPPDFGGVKYTPSDKLKFCYFGDLLLKETWVC